MKKIIYLSLLWSFMILGNTMAQESIFPKGEKAPNVHHTGDVWLTSVQAANEIFPHNIAVATFAANAKLNWHMHPKGQQLIILDGVGIYQERDQAVQILEKGDMVQCAPGVEHWHASTPEKGVTYLAISGDAPTEWFELIPQESFESIDVEGLKEKALAAKITQLSKDKWQWMADKNVAALEDLFHEKSEFVHMGGSWGKEREINIIKSGGIWYKQADIHEVSVQIIDDTAILLNRIDLLAVVGGNEVTNPFMVTEVYKELDGKWKLASLSFTKLLN